MNHNSDRNLVSHFDNTVVIRNILLQIAELNV
jgi:hypothetical protein